MQTFLPYRDFAASAATLDRQRLGKQRVEVLQILRAIHDPDYGWQNHPATRMWRHHSDALVEYGLAVCSEWVSRGYKDTCYDKIAAFDTMTREMPEWLDDESVMLSHRSNLIRKMPEHYGPMWPDVPDNLEYVWPI